MYSREESALLRKEFWVSFGKSFPRKWVLYNTKIKDFGFKFVADTKKAAVVLDIESSTEEQRILLYEQVLALKNIIVSEYLPEAVFDQDFYLENGKCISRITVHFNEKFSIHNKNTWQACYEFFVETMSQFELFWFEYEDYIKQAVV